LLSVTPVPVLAAIPSLRTCGEQQKQSLYQRLEMAAALALMAAIPAMIVFSYYRG
jgi:hypothetical protein